MNFKKLEIEKFNLNNALLLLLGEIYNSEFEVIDGLCQHKNGMNFYQWLYQRGLIERDEYDRIKQEIETWQKEETFN